MSSVRAVLRKSILGTIVFAASAATALVATVDRANARGSEVVTLTQGTNIAVTISPDRQGIIMDLQGVLWQLPANGGTATRLTKSLLEPARPDWSPRGDLVAFQAYSGGTFHIWTMKPDGTDLRQVTSGHGDHREPHFSPDGTKIAFSSDRAFTGSYDIWIADVATGALTQATTDGTLEEFEPAWSPDGTSLALVSGTSSSGNRIEILGAAGTRTTFVIAPTGARLNAPSWAPDGKNIAYVQFQNNVSQLMVSGKPVATNKDVFPFPARWLSANELLYTGDGKILVSDIATGNAREVPFAAEVKLNRPPYQRKKFDFDSRGQRQAQGIVGPTLSPDGRKIAFQALNQIWVMGIGGLPRQLTNDSYYKADPAWSPDGSKLAYSSDKAGTEDIYVLDLASRSERRVTSLPGAEVSSAWSPDGRTIAFQDQTGATHTVKLANGSVRRVVPSLFAPGKPTWAASGNTIAIAALKPYTRRFREGTSQILTADVGSGALTYWEPAPFKSLSTRGEDGPVLLAGWIGGGVRDGKHAVGHARRRQRPSGRAGEADHVRIDRRADLERRLAKVAVSVQRQAAAGVAQWRRSAHRAGGPCVAPGPTDERDGHPRRTLLGRPRCCGALERRHHRRQQSHRQHRAASPPAAR